MVDRPVVVSAKTFGQPTPVTRSQPGLKSGVPVNLPQGLQGSF